MLLILSRGDSKGSQKEACTESLEGKEKLLWEIWESQAQKRELQAIKKVWIIM